MSPSFRHRSVLAGIALGVLVLSGCGSDAKVVKTRDGKVTVAKDGKSVTIEGESGAEATFGSSTVPDGFPSEVPLPKGLRLVSSAGSQRSFTLGYGFGSRDEDRVISNYLDRLAAAGLTPTGNTGANPFASGSAEGHGWRVAASVMTPKLLTVVVTRAG